MSVDGRHRQAALRPRPSGARAAAGSTSDRRVRIVHVYPHLLGTYGDAGNALVLRKRAADRGIAGRGGRRPAGGAAAPQRRHLPARRRRGRQADRGGAGVARRTAVLAAAAQRGAAVLGICAGYQLLGETFLGVGGVVTPGLGLLDVRTDRLEHRAVGNVLANPGWELGSTELIGFENHGGATIARSGRQAAGSGRGRRRQRRRLRRPRERSRATWSAPTCTVRCWR